MKTLAGRPAHQDESWRVDLLGGLTAARGDRRVTRFHTQKSAALLAYLSYYRVRSHPREVLVEILWPEEDLDVARHRLRVALSFLRRELEPPGTAAGTILVTDRATVRLGPAVTTDVAEFEQALHEAARAGASSEHA